MYLLYLFLSGYDRFYYDADSYWQQGGSFERGGHFSLYNFPGSSGGFPRGYSLPLLNHGLHVVASSFGIGDVTAVKIFGALLAATLGVVVVPRLARTLLPGASVGWVRILVLNALIFLYWRDHFDFPLSDFPALVLAGVALLALLRATATGYLVAGLCFGLAANVRPAYLITLLLAIVLTALTPLRLRDWRQRGLATALVVAGAFVAVLPQILINHHQSDSWSPLVVGQHDISLLQLSDGMQAQKYETYVGSFEDYPRPQVFYRDPSTQHVLEHEHLSKQTILFGQDAPITSYGQYLGIVLRNPAEMAAAFARRIFNGVDVRYPTPYVRDLDDTSLVLSLLQYTLLFAAIASLALTSARRTLGRIRWAGIGLFVSPCLTAIPGAVEPRFFLPLTVLVYAIVCFGPATRASFFAGGAARRAALAASYAGFLVACLTLSSATLAQLEHPGQTLGLGKDRRLAGPVGVGPPGQRSTPVPS